MSDGLNRRESGFTLAEIVLGGMVLAVAAAAILGAYIGQATLNEHSRNLSAAIHDANRVIELIRQQDATCTTPSIAPPDPDGPGALVAPTSWNAWMDQVTTWPQANAYYSPRGKSVPTANPSNEERIVVTCTDRDGYTGAASVCGTGGAPAQVGTGEWQTQAGTTTFNPLRVTVAVCWRHRGRTIGECGWNGAALTSTAADEAANTVPNDTANVFESPAMLTTLVTCRG